MPMIQRRSTFLTALTMALAAALAGAVAHAAPLVAGASAPGGDSGRVSAPLVDRVRGATDRYRDINVAIGEGWVQATPCVSGPEFGAMGSTSFCRGDLVTPWSTRSSRRR